MQMQRLLIIYLVSGDMVAKLVVNDFWEDWQAATRVNHGITFDTSINLP